MSMRWRRARLTGVVAVAGTALALALAGCGEEGSSGTASPTGAATGPGCAPVRDAELVVLTDDKSLQTVDNIIPAINAKAAQTALLTALDRVSASMDTDTLIGLNRQAAVDRKTPATIAQTYVAAKKLTDGLPRGAGAVTVGAANFPESEILANIYARTLRGAGYDTTVRTIGNRELYLPALRKGEVHVFPEYVGTLATFLNKQQNGSGAPEVASSDLARTVANLTALGKKAGLTFGKPSRAADQNAFAVTKKLAEEKKLRTLSDFAKVCSGAATVLGGPPECPQRPFCQQGLAETYGLVVGDFLALDAGGPRVLAGLRTGQVTIGLVFSSDGTLSHND